MHPAAVRRVRIALNGFLPPLFLCVAMAGCGSKEDDVQLVPVSGKVTFENKPLPYGSVTFYPDKAKGNNSKKIGEGRIEGEGTYTLSTAGKAGIAAGWYKVTVNNSGTSDPAQAKMKLVQFRQDYNDVKSTPLSKEVKENAPAGSYDLTVTR